MKTNHAILSAAAVLVLTLPLASAKAQQWSTNTLPPGLISWWRAETDYLDSTGTNHGAPVGGTGFAAGRVRQCFTFSGTNQGVRISHAASLDVPPTGFTVEFWMKAGKDQPDTISSIVDKDHSAQDNTGWEVSCWRDSGRLSVGIGDGSSFPLCTNRTDVLDNQFHHVAFAWDRTNWLIYVDGMLESQLYRPSVANNTRPLRFGYHWGDGTGTPIRYFKGLLDEVRLYKRALSATEITVLCAGSPVPALVGRWSGEENFQDSMGTNAGTSGGGVSFTNGKLGSAFRFVNAANSTIQLPNSPTFQPSSNQFTIEAWVKPDFTSSNIIDTILERRDGGCGSEPYSFLFSILKSYPGYPPGVFGLGMLPQISYLYSTNRIPDDGQFHHIAVTYNGNKPTANCTLYLDGCIVGGGNGPGPIPPSGIGPYIGVHRCLNANSSMTLDELAFYGRELAPGEIAALYRAAGGKATTFIPSGLVSWWRGENDANDATSAHPGTPQGGLGYTPGQIGQAFSLNGQNAAVALGNWFNFQQFTLSFWVNPAASQVQWADILDNNHTDYRSWVFQSGNNSSGTTSQWSWGAAGVAGDYYWLSNSAWQHVVATMSSDHVTQLYVNGQSRSKMTGAGPVAYDGTQFMNLGKHQLMGRYFNGLVDELMVFDRPLDSAEVTSLYVNQGGPPTLDIKLAGGDVLLSWPSGNAGLVLQSSADMSAGSWRAVTNGLQPAGARTTWLGPSTDSSQFFRLKSGN